MKVCIVQVRDLEKQQSRLKEVFKTQVSNFREACYCLFGYRIDMASQVGLRPYDPHYPNASSATALLQLGEQVAVE